MHFVRNTVIVSPFSDHMNMDTYSKQSYLQGSWSENGFKWEIGHYSQVKDIYFYRLNKLGETFRCPLFSVKKRTVRKWSKIRAHYVHLKELLPSLSIYIYLINRFGETFRCPPFDVQPTAAILYWALNRDNIFTFVLLFFKQKSF